MRRWIRSSKRSSAMDSPSGLACTSSDTPSTPAARASSNGNGKVTSSNRTTPSVCFSLCSRSSCCCSSLLLTSPAAASLTLPTTPSPATPNTLSSAPPPRAGCRTLCARGSTASCRRDTGRGRWRSWRPRWRWSFTASLSRSATPTSPPQPKLHPERVQRAMRRRSQRRRRPLPRARSCTPTSETCTSSGSLSLGSRAAGAPSGLDLLAEIPRLCDVMRWDGMGVM
mmetsp:Transcript_13601/g.26785  ORF Transcript_13601/g.26785 Transcript_13601/m.26785 type:complete len:226 (+) Transcript_13601:422-1099(+)